MTVRLSVFCGFLGSGKTTFLRHQVRLGALGSAALIINEAAEAPVDPALLPDHAVRVLSGGCVCCSALDALMTLLAQMAAQGTKQIVLETSGLADPGPIRAALSRPDSPVLLGEVVTVVDALHGLATLQGEPLARAQVIGADALILSKLDAADAKDVAVLVATLRQMNPGAPLFGAVKGAEVPVPDDALALPVMFEADPTDGPIAAFTLPLGAQPDWTAISLWVAGMLHARGGQVLRMKAVVRTPAGRLLLQTVRQTIQTPEILPDLPDDSDNRLVVIGRGLTQADLASSLRRFTHAGVGPTLGLRGR